MAVLQRLRLLSVTSGGNPITLGASLSSSTAGSSDTITFSGVLEYADGTSVSITSGSQYLPVVVDPGTAIAEEIWVTATPNGSFQATCLRGMGSSTGAPAHSLGATVVHGPTPADMSSSAERAAAKIAAYSLVR